MDKIRIDIPGRETTEITKVIMYGEEAETGEAITLIAGYGADEIEFFLRAYLWLSSRVRRIFGSDFESTLIRMWRIIDKEDSNVHKGDVH